ncbi:MAG: hypothetical protein WBG86_20535, partial [Polyangiales bacterium]
QALTECPTGHGRSNPLVRGWRWMNNDRVNFACTFAGAVLVAVTILSALNGQTALSVVNGNGRPDDANSIHRRVGLDRAPVPLDTVALLGEERTSV